MASTHTLNDGDRLEIENFGRVEVIHAAGGKVVLRLVPDAGAEVYEDFPYEVVAGGGVTEAHYRDLGGEGG